MSTDSEFGVDSSSAGAGGVATADGLTSSASTLAAGAVSGGKDPGGVLTGGSPEGADVVFGSEECESCDMRFPLRYGLNDKHMLPTPYLNTQAH